jgi:hypothetical protein
MGLWKSLFGSGFSVGDLLGGYSPDSARYRRAQEQLDLQKGKNSLEQQALALQEQRQWANMWGDPNASQEPTANAIPATHRGMDISASSATRTAEPDAIQTALAGLKADGVIGSQAPVAMRVLQPAQTGGSTLPAPVAAGAGRNNPFIKADGSVASYQDMMANPMLVRMMNSPNKDVRDRVKDWLQEARAGRPEYTQMGDNIVNKNDPRDRQFNPNIPEGAQPVYNEAGALTGYQTLQGYIKLTEDKAAATARGSARFNPVQVQGPNGEIYTTTQEDFSDRFGQGRGGVTGQNAGIVQQREAATRAATQRQADIQRALTPIGIVRDTSTQMRDIWGKEFKGKMSQVTGYIPDMLSASNQRYGALGQQMKPLVGGLLGLTAQQLDTDKGMAQLQAYIPLPTDSDQTAEAKFNRLEALANARERSIKQQYAAAAPQGGAAPERRVAPVPGYNPPQRGRSTSNISPTEAAALLAERRRRRGQ